MAKQSAKQWARSMAESARQAVQRERMTTFTDAGDGHPKIVQTKRKAK